MQQHGSKYFTRNSTNLPCLTSVLPATHQILRILVFPFFVGIVMKFGNLEILRIRRLLFPANSVAQFP